MVMLLRKCHNNILYINLKRMLSELLYTFSNKKTEYCLCLYGNWFMTNDSKMFTFETRSHVLIFSYEL